MSPVAATVLAAGAVCWREIAPGNVEVLLVHRPQHQDVSLPKGKVDPGETLPQTAVREIVEETGLAVALGAPLGTVSYRLPNGRPKRVHYWAAEVSPDAIAASTFTSNDEISEITWVPIAVARQRLSYPHDGDVLARFEALFRSGHARTFAVVLLRHGKALPPGAWDGPDATRPLMQVGVDQAASVAPGVAAFGPFKLISSPAERCQRTIAPIAAVTGLPVKLSDKISQDEYRSDGKAAARVIAKRLRKGVTAVLCSHGPVLPQLLGALTEQTGAAASARRSARQFEQAGALAVGSFAVVHVSVAHPENGFVAIEVHSPTV